MANVLTGKKIIVGVTGSIAAYKAAVLVRLLKKEGAEVKVIMTEAATKFVTPVTLATLSENPVLIDFYKDKTGEWHNHVALGLWADIFLVAPASAATLAKMASGLADSLLLATYLSARCVTVVAPAMDLDMFAHPATQKNLATLQQYGNVVIEPQTGELASGLIGKGRMAEPENIVAFIQNLLFLANKNELLGKKVVVTAGTTHEYIDPVRYIANASTGKMGYAIAEAFAQRGASVTLISGPATAKVSHPNVQKISVITALEMLEATQNHYQQADIAVFAAAVADYRVAHQAVEKIKKKEENLTLELIKNPDIAAEMGKLKKPNQYNIGFALETHNPVENALKKLVGKNFNLVVLNSLQDEGAGFGYDTNKVTFIEADKQTVLPLKSKTDIAMDIVEKVINEYVVK